MIEREQVLAEADSAAAALKRLRGRLANDGCNPPAVVTAKVVAVLASTAARLTKLDLLVQDTSEKRGPGVKG